MRAVPKGKAKANPKADAAKKAKAEQEAKEEAAAKEKAEQEKALSELKAQLADEAARNEKARQQMETYEERLQQSEKAVDQAVSVLTPDKDGLLQQLIAERKARDAASSRVDVLEAQVHARKAATLAALKRSGDVSSSDEENTTLLSGLEAAPGNRANEAQWTKVKETLEDKVRTAEATAEALQEERLQLREQLAVASSRVNDVATRGELQHELSVSRFQQELTSAQNQSKELQRRLAQTEQAVEDAEDRHRRTAQAQERQHGTECEDLMRRLMSETRLREATQASVKAMEGEKDALRAHLSAVTALREQAEEPHARLKEQVQQHFERLQALEAENETHVEARLEMQEHLKEQYRRHEHLEGERDSLRDLVYHVHGEVGMSKDLRADTLSAPVEVFSGSYGSMAASGSFKGRSPTALKIGRLHASPPESLGSTTLDLNEVATPMTQSFAPSERENLIEEINESRSLNEEIQMALARERCQHEEELGQERARGQLAEANLAQLKTSFESVVTVAADQVESFRLEYVAARDRLEAEEQSLAKEQEHCDRLQESLEAAEQRLESEEGQEAVGLRLELALERRRADSHEAEAASLRRVLASTEEEALQALHRRQAAMQSRTHSAGPRRVLTSEVRPQCYVGSQVVSPSLASGAPTNAHSTGTSLSLPTSSVPGSLVLHDQQLRRVGPSTPTTPVYNPGFSLSSPSLGSSATPGPLRTPVVSAPTSMLSPPTFEVRPSRSLPTGVASGPAASPRRTPVSPRATSNVPRIHLPLPTDSVLTTPTETPRELGSPTRAMAAADERISQDLALASLALPPPSFAQGSEGYRKLPPAPYRSTEALY